MGLKVFLRLTACTTGFIGTVLILFPHFTADFFFAAPAHNEDIFIQFVGSSLIGYTWLNWFSARHTDSGQIRSVLIGNFSTLLIAFIISIVGVAEGTFKSTGWFIVGVHFIFGGGFGWYLLKKQSI